MKKAAPQFKIPKIRELPSGMFTCQLRINGQSISITDSTHELVYARAVATKAGIIEMKNNPDRITVGEAVEKYIKAREGVLSPTTIAEYRWEMEKIEPIANVRLCELNQNRVQSFVSSLARSVSPKTCKNIYFLLSAALKEHNIVFNVKLPQKRKIEYAIPSEDDIIKIFDACRGTDIELPVLLALVIGLRMSEIRGLKKSDLKENVLQIRRAMVDDRSARKSVIKDPKNYTSARDEIIPDFLCDLIKSAPDKEYLITMSGKSIYNRFKKLCANHNIITSYRFHDLRHANASVMLMLGIPNKYAQQRMGHSTDNMLKTVYQHTMQKQSDIFAQKINDYFDNINLLTKR